MRRLFYVAFGAAAGIVIARRVTATANKWTPEALAAQAGGAGERIAVWWAEVKAYSAHREAELREALGLEDGGSDAVS
jgi:hypothetical protein